MRHPTIKIQPATDNSQTATPNHTPPSLAPHRIEAAKQFSTLRAELALRGYSVEQEYVIRLHGQQTAIVASIEALATFVRGVL